MWLPYGQWQPTRFLGCGEYRVLSAHLRSGEGHRSLRLRANSYRTQSDTVAAISLVTINVKSRPNSKFPTLASEKQRFPSLIRPVVLGPRKIRASFQGNNAAPQVWYWSNLRDRTTSAEVFCHNLQTLLTLAQSSSARSYLTSGALAR